MPVGCDFSGVTEASMVEIVKELTAVMQKAQAAADAANIRITELLKENQGRWRRIS